jgi:toxin ParE1/3/4
MTVRWSPEAATDFAAIVDYIRKENPSASERVAHTIYDSISSLISFPHRGRPGKIKDTRELVLTPLPFIAIYRVQLEVVKLHACCTAQNVGHSPTPSK